MDNLTKLMVEELKSTQCLFMIYYFNEKIKCNFNQKTRNKKAALSKGTIILFEGNTIFGQNSKIKNGTI
jgi:hypothetical protein